MTAADLARLLFADLLAGRVVVNELREEKAVRIIARRLSAVVADNRAKLLEARVLKAEQA